MPSLGLRTVVDRNVVRLSPRDVCHGETHDAETEKSTLPCLKLGFSAGKLLSELPDGCFWGRALDEPQHKRCSTKGNVSDWRIGKRVLC